MNEMFPLRMAILREKLHVFFLLRQGLEAARHHPQPPPPSYNFFSNPSGVDISYDEEEDDD